MAHPALRNVVTTGVKNNLKPFIDKELSVVTTLIEVAAGNSPHKGRKINVYNSTFIEAMIRAYATFDCNGRNLCEARIFDLER